MSNTTIKDEVNIQKLYGLEATLSKEDFLKKYRINENGLSSEEANEKIHKLGLNEIKQAKPRKWYHYFLESFTYHSK